MKTPAAVFEAAPVGLFSFPPGDHSGNLLLRLTGKMENKLRQAITGRVSHMMSGDSQDSRFSSAPLTNGGMSFTWKRPVSWTVSAVVWRQVSDPSLQKNQSCLHTEFPGKLQNLPVLCTVLNGPSLVL